MVKHVLFFRPHLSIGGSDRVTSTLLRHLDRSRFRVSLALVRAEGPFLDEVPGDVDVHVLDAPRLALSVPRLVRVLRKVQPDVLFCTCSASNIIATVAHRLARCRARLILSERSTLYRGRSRLHPKQALEVALKKVVYPRADLVTAVSQGVADQVAGAVRLAPGRLVVVYNPMVEDDLAERATEAVTHPWFADDVPIVVACGRMVPQKDYPTLLAAFAEIRRRRPARLWVLGEGPLRAELEARARALGLGDDVCFAGFDKNPFKYMARAQLLLQASSTEGLPGSLIQAMACGTPVVSTDCDFGPREVIASPGEDGFLVPVGDSRALAERALTLLGDPARRAAMAAAAKRSVSRFTVAASMARYEAAIDGLPVA